MKKVFYTSEGDPVGEYMKDESLIEKLYKEGLAMGYREIELKTWTRMDQHHPDWCLGYVQGMRVAMRIIQNNLRKFLNEQR